jgi:hypothetical protein
MIDIEARACAKPRREERLRSFAEARRFNFPVRSRNPGRRR